MTEKEPDKSKDDDKEARELAERLDRLDAARQARLLSSWDNRRKGK